jgi:hypothetical protein
MKKILLTIGLALSLALSAYALQKQVTTVSGTSSTIFTPAVSCQWVTIANTGSGDVWLSFDGTAATSAGFPLIHGTTITLVYAGSSQKGPIKAILQTATTTTLNINTPETSSQ